MKKERRSMKERKLRMALNTQEKMMEIKKLKEEMQGKKLEKKQRNSADSMTREDLTRDVMNGMTSNVTAAESGVLQVRKDNNNKKRKAVNGHGNVTSNTTEDEIDTPKKKSEKRIFTPKEEENMDTFALDLEESRKDSINEDSDSHPERKKICKEEEEESDTFSDLDGTEDDPLKELESLDVVTKEEEEEEDSSQTESLPFKGKPPPTAEERAKQEERTVFVGNVNLKAKRFHLKNFFSNYGKVG